MAKQKLNPCLTFGRVALTKLDSLQNRTAGELPYDLGTYGSICANDNFLCLFSLLQYKSILQIVQQHRCTCWSMSLWSKVLHFEWSLHCGCFDWDLKRDVSDCIFSSNRGNEPSPVSSAGETSMGKGTIKKYSGHNNKLFQSMRFLTETG